MKKILLTFIFVLFLISLASAEIQSLGTLKQNDNVNLIQTCGSCTFNNITSVLYPNSSIAISNVQMTKEGTFYNYTFSDTNTLGNYIVNGVGDLGGIDTVWNYDFEITPSGFKITNNSIIYSVLLIIIFLMDILFLFIILSLSFENPRNEEGNYIGVSLKKYGKVVMIGIFYGLVLLTLNLMNAMAQNVSGISQFTGIIGGLFLLMLNASWVWTISIIIWIGIMMWKDGSLIKFIEKNINELHDRL